MDRTDRDRCGEPLSRRAMLETTAAAMAVPLLGPRVAPYVPQGTAPKFLTTAEFALLDELAELIIPADAQSPGARAAGVAAYLDGRLAESLRPEWQELWRSGLAAVEQLSHEMNGSAMMEASPAQRVAVLERMAGGEKDPQTAPERFFTELKSWTVQGYYTSKIGIHQDQEYKGNVYQTGEFAGYDAT